MAQKQLVLIDGLIGSTALQFQGAIRRQQYQWYTGLIGFEDGWIPVCRGAARGGDEDHGRRRESSHAEGEKRRIFMPDVAE